MVVWNLDDIYPEADTETLISSLQDSVKKFVSHRENLRADMDSEAFMSILHEREKIMQLSSKLGCRASLWSCENTSDSKRNAHEARINEITAHLGNDILFFSLWFKELSDSEASKFIEASGPYRYHLERIRAFKPYTLSEKEEQLINVKDVTGISTVVKLYDIITNRYRFPWKGKEITQEEINVFKQSLDRNERKESYDLVLGKYGTDEDLLGEIYRNIALDWKNESVKIRGYANPIAVRNHANDVPDAAVDALLSVVRKNISVFQEYFLLKSKLLGLDTFDRYDLYTPYKELEKEFSYEECKNIVLDTYTSFSPDAGKMAQSIFDAGHVHSDLTPNKRSGAFCMSVLTSIPPYILLNHVNKLNDLFTMMHEFGHGIHDRAAAHQTDFTFHSTLPLAETASTFGEMLLSQRLMKEGSAEEKIAILVKMLDGQYASIARQSYFVLFEKEAHEKIAAGASVDDLNSLYYENLKEQFGFDVGDVFKHEWKYIPHIFHTPFYCYAYAFGNLLVLALYKMYQEEGEDFVPKYMKILSYGGSKAPASILSEVGIDITSEEFWEKGFSIIREEIEELKKLTVSN